MAKNFKLNNRRKSEFQESLDEGRLMEIQPMLVERDIAIAKASAQRAQAKADVVCLKRELQQLNLDQMRQSLADKRKDAEERKKAARTKDLENEYVENLRVMQAIGDASDGLYKIKQSRNQAILDELAEE